MNSTLAVDLIKLLISKFDLLYEFLKAGIDYMALASKVKSLSHIFDFISQSIMTVGNMFA